MREDVRKCLKRVRNPDILKGRHTRMNDFSLVIIRSFAEDRCRDDIQPVLRRDGVGGPPRATTRPNTTHGFDSAAAARHRTRSARRRPTQGQNDADRRFERHAWVNHGLRRVERDPHCSTDIAGTTTRSHRTIFRSRLVHAVYTVENSNRFLLIYEVTKTSLAITLYCSENKNRKSLRILKCTH